MNDPATIANGLSEAQKRFICNASKRPKKWMAIRRHAKLPDTVPVHKMYVPLRLIEPVRGFGNDRWRLSNLGIAVRAYLENSHEAK